MPDCMEKLSTICICVGVRKGTGVELREVLGPATWLLDTGLEDGVGAAALNACCRQTS